MRGGQLFTFEWKPKNYFSADNRGCPNFCVNGLMAGNCQVESRLLPILIHAKISNKLRTDFANHYYASRKSTRLSLFDSEAGMELAIQNLDKSAKFLVF